MKQLIVCVGLPRSGKTTWSRFYASKHGCAIVNPDSVRLAIHGQRFILEAEGFVWATVRAMVKALFLAGHELVIVDATNVTRKRRDDWKARGSEWQTVFKVFDTPMSECLKRAQATEDTEIVPVIERMAGEWEPLGLDEERL